MPGSQSKLLAGKVAVVAGATRGAGRGIACGLGEAGATVYCTGRSIRGKPATASRPETIEQTAEMVTARGGLGIHAQVDHTVEDQVQALFARVKHEQGRLDILVNDVWGGDALTEWGKRFWEMTMEKGLTMLERAVHSHIITSRWGVPLMIERKQGLIIEITDGASDYYRGNLFYDLVKTSVIRLAHDMALELRQYDITALALTPGFLRSEMMLDHFGVTEDTWRDAVEKEPHFAQSETPFYVGRAVAALAADPNVSRFAGKALASWNLAQEYGFKDVDGRQPDFGGHIRNLVTDVLLDLARSGKIPSRTKGKQREEALKQFKRTVQQEFKRIHLSMLLEMRPGNVYEHILELGPEPEAAAVRELVGRDFSFG